VGAGGGVPGVRRRRRAGVHPTHRGDHRGATPERQGVASAVNDAAREIGAAIGIAILGSLFDTGYRARVSDLLRHSTVPGAAALRNAPAALTAGTNSRAGQTVRDGVLAGWRLAFVATAVALALLAPLALRFARPRAVDRRSRRPRSARRRSQRSANPSPCLPPIGRSQAGVALAGSGDESGAQSALADDVT
jgi:hypothetical protein